MVASYRMAQLFKPCFHPVDIGRASEGRGAVWKVCKGPEYSGSLDLNTLDFTRSSLAYCGCEMRYGIGVWPTYAIRPLTVFH